MALLSALLAVAVLAVYWPVFGHEFILYDDPESVMVNPLLQDGLSWQGVWRAFGAPYAGFWIPVTWLSYMLDVELFGRGPAGFHVTNVVVHCANTVLLLLLLWRLTGSVWRSALATALFALHPLRVESVAWIAQRKDLLAGGFFFAALLAYGAYARRGGKLRYAAVAVALTLGMMSKPVLVCAPMVLLLLDFWPLGRLRLGSGPMSSAPDRPPWCGLVLEKVPFFALSAVFAAVALLAHGDAIAPLEGFSLLRRLEMSASSYFIYLQRMVWPRGLALVTADFHPFANLWRLGAAALGLMTVSGAVGLVARRVPFLAVGWFWYVVLLLPMSGLFPSGIWATADRFTYVPQIGICLCAAWSLGFLLPTRAWAISVGVFLSISAVAALAATSCAQVRYWQDTSSLFGRTLAVQPEDPFAHEKLGQVLLEAGDLEGAVRHLRRTLLVTPKNPFAHSWMGLARGRLGDLDGATYHLGRAVELDPALAEARFNLGVALEQRGSTAEAVAQYREALRLHPDDNQARYNLALALVSLRKNTEARREFEELTRRDPESPQAYLELARLCGAEGDPAGARRYLEKAKTLPSAAAQAEGATDAARRDAVGPASGRP